ncbi:MAG: hypothetical protein ABI285_01330, partial [Ginsengibacter sp.]
CFFIFPMKIGLNKCNSERLHYLLNASARRPDCFKIDLKVPKGISFLSAGTITVSVGTPVLRYFL